MKRFLTLLLCIVSINAYSQVEFEPNGKTQITVDNAEHNFGKIKEKKGVVEHDFIIKNTSNTPFIIHEVTTTCGCTVPSFSKKPLMPKDSSKIIVKFNPKNRPGYFSKRIYIWSGDNGVSNILLIKGYVER